MTKPKLKREALAQLAVIMLDMATWGTWGDYNLSDDDQVRLQEVCLELREEFMRRAGTDTAFDIATATLRK